MNESTAPCPHCGVLIRLDSKFCRHCGSSESDGWRHVTDDDFADDDVTDDDFDYDEFIDQEFSTSVTNRQTRPIWRLVAIVLLLLFAAAFLLP